MRLSLYEHSDGVEPAPGNRIVYDVGRGEAWFGEVGVEGHALVWELTERGGEGALLSAELELGFPDEWLLRCDRIDFPPRGIAYRHTHPGGGIRYLLRGSLAIEAPGHSRLYRPGEAWFEAAGYPVLAIASEREETAFVRVLVLPLEWEGKRTIRYIDPADEARPKLQRATVFLERRIDL